MEENSSTRILHAIMKKNKKKNSLLRSSNVLADEDIVQEGVNGIMNRKDEDRTVMYESEKVGTIG